MSGTFLTGVPGMEDSLLNDSQDLDQTPKKTPRTKAPAKVEDTEQLIRLQKKAIERMSKENDKLREEVAVLSKCHTTSVSTTDVQIARSLMNQADHYTRQVELEKRKLADLTKQVRVLSARFEDIKQKSGSANVKPDGQVKKHIRILEDRLDRAVVRFNDALGVNKRLREDIDHLRRERSAFEQVVDRVTKELQKKKEDIARHTEVTNIAYEARDLARARIRQMTLDRDKERRQMGETFNDLDSRLKHLTEEAQQLRNLEQDHAGNLTADEESKLKKKNFAGLLGKAAEKAHLEEETSQVRMFHEAFQQIKEATGVTDVNELVDCFVAAEDENFTLFNFMNELHSEAARLEEQIGEFKRELEELQGSGGDQQRKSLLKSLESRLAGAEERAKHYDEAYDKGSDTIKRVTALVENIYKSIQADKELGPQQDMDLGQHGVTESNILSYLGIIEQRTASLMRAKVRQDLAKENAESRAEVSAEKPGSRESGGVGTMAMAAPATNDFGAVSEARVMAGSLGRGPGSPAGKRRVDVEPPAIRDDSGGSSGGEDEDERPLTMDEIKSKMLRGLEKRSMRPAGKDKRKKDRKR